MRIKSLAAAAILAIAPWHAGAQDAGVADTDDFVLETGEDLADLCGAAPDSPIYVEAIQFCYGFMEGVMQYHDALSVGPDFKPLVCPNVEVTRAEAVAIYVAWAKANPARAAGEWPGEALIEAALDKWGPCDQ